MIKIKESKMKACSNESSYLFTLPKVWVDDLELGEGDILEFYRDENDFLILKGVKNDKKTI